jgi:hypothetical protein
MPDQTIDEIRIVQEINKARNHERKMSDRQRKHELFIDGRKQLDNLANAYNKAENLEFKKLYKDKWFKLIKVYANKIERK